jgi:hypothetical protein
MRPRGKLEMIAGLIAVQRARVSAAEAALSAAQAAEAAAREAEDKALKGSEAAHSDWLHCLSKPGFAPEQSRGLSLLLIERAKESEEAAFRARITADVHERRRSDWQKLEAQARSSKESLRKLRRRESRRTEEKRLNGLAERITYEWTRT